MSELVLVDQPSPGVRVLTLNRPDELNAMTAELCAALHDELAAAGGDRSCRAVVLTGAGRAFCAGLDLRGYGSAPGNDGSDAARDRLGNQEHMSRLVLGLRGLPQPVIAAVNGPAAGLGFALTLGLRYPLCRPGGRLPGRVHQHRRVQLRHGHELASSTADRGLPLARNDAHRAPSERRGGAGHRAGGRCGGGLGPAGPLGGGGESDRRPRPVGRPPDQAGMWTALEIGSEQAAIEFEDRQQIWPRSGPPAGGGGRVPGEAPGGVRGLMRDLFTLRTRRRWSPAARGESAS